MRLNQSSVLRLTILACMAAAGYSANSVAIAACTDTNTCVGEGAGAVNETTETTAIGFVALGSNTLGRENTAVGANALRVNTRGEFNTAVGVSALEENTTGLANTATGRNAMSRNSTGGFNTAVGYNSLQINDVGRLNTAVGESALQTNRGGSFNTAMGVAALSGQVGGSFGNNNTATGYFALGYITVGNSNTATGNNAAQHTTTGDFNTAVGTGALRYNETGVRNVALGYQAGHRIEGSDNIIIGSGTLGTAAENGIIRIGSGPFQKKAFIAGVRGVTTGLANATTVFVDGNGQLGTINSSREAKEDIQPMGAISERLLTLRPVTFRYKEANDEGNKPVQFGLIAEEVAETFPELVVYDVNGKPETVSYHLLATLLLNEFQKAHAVIETQANHIAALEAQTAELAQLKKQFAEMASVIERLDQARMVAAAH